MYVYNTSGTHAQAHTRATFFIEPGSVSANRKILLLIIFSHYFPAPPLKGPWAPGVIFRSCSSEAWLPGLRGAGFEETALDNSVAQNLKIHQLLEAFLRVP